MATVATTFIDCTTLSIVYDIMGLVTINYTMVSNQNGFQYQTDLTAGGRTFRGYVIDLTLNHIPNTDGWYETHVTLLATTY